MRLLMISGLLMLVGCGSVPTASNPPAPAVIKVPVATYVPIDPELTKRCQWIREDKPSQVFEVSNGRKRCLQQYEAQLDGVQQVQGQPAPRIER